MKTVFINLDDNSRSIIKEENEFIYLNERQWVIINGENWEVYGPGTFDNDNKIQKYYLTQETIKNIAIRYKT